MGKYRLAVSLSITRPRWWPGTRSVYECRARLMDDVNEENGGGGGDRFLGSVEKKSADRFRSPGTAFYHSSCIVSVRRGGGID